MAKSEKTFEESIARLEEIVGALEKGDVQLADSLKLFEEGTKLAGACEKMLDEAEQKVIKLSKGADGAPVESKFTGEAEGNGR
ncbi:MAG: exodeoxyribonuclease VII small subunit [Oscillospiraceae bacterium]|nr:exodeoxyribonuclease VII small subunit [Oscillospiraceae bacterium]